MKARRHSPPACRTVLSSVVRVRRAAAGKRESMSWSDRGSGAALTRLVSTCGYLSN